ncbi:MAG: M23 family metallopeptidase [Parvibaculum sp.]|nr:M23 family metallopeptidase [Parvibaculum sp.]
MNTLRRSLLVFALALLGAVALEWADDTQVMDPFGLKRAQVAEDYDVNLGDCLLGQTNASWPASYRAICADLARGGDGPLETSLEASAAYADLDALQSMPEAKTQPKEQVAKAYPMPALERPASLKLISTKPAATVKPVTLEAKLVAAPTCIIDEHGATTLQKKGSPRILPPQLARLKANGIAQPGVALVVEIACTVASPVDGKVMYAGDFKGYRGIVIIRMKSGQQLIVAGLDRIDVKRGTRITRGMHLGATSSELAPALASAYNPAHDNTLLYFDLRNKKGAGEKLSWLPQTS